MATQDAARVGDSVLGHGLAGSDAAVALLHGGELVVAYANPAHQAMFGWPPGSSLRESAPGSPLLATADSVLATGIPARVDEAALNGNRTASVVMSPVADDPAAPGGVLMVALETTAQVRARQRVENRNERLTVLDQATTAVTSDLDWRRELAALADSVVPSLADACAIYLIDRAPPRGRGRAATPEPVRATRLVCVIDPATGITPPAPEIRLTIAPTRPVARAVTSRQPVLAQGAECDIGSWGVGWLTALEPHSLVAVPLGSPEVLAVVNFVARGARPRYQSTDLSLMREITTRADTAVGHAMRLQHATEVALALQRGLLSDPVELDWLDLCVRYRPAVPGLQVGGDWYDTLHLPTGELALAVGDVVGHDLYAVSTMGQLRSMVQALACQPAAQPAAVLTALNRLSTHLDVGNLATVIYGQLAPHRSGGATLTWANAGHPPPVLIHPDGRHTVLEHTPSAMLALTDDPITQASTHLAPGSLLLLYTDGLIENPDRPSTDPITDLATAAAAHRHLELGDLCDRLVAAAPTADDIALVAARVRA